MSTTSLQEIFDTAFNAHTLRVLLDGVAHIAAPTPGTDLYRMLTLACRIAAELDDDLDTLSEDAAEAEAAAARGRVEA